ncbi:MAG: hypothetical protein WAT23_16200 [Chromatiaceae bacterium]
MTRPSHEPAASILYQVPIAQLEAYRGRDLIVRSTDASAIASQLGADDLANLAYVQLTSLRCDPDALVQWAPGLPIELLLDDPAVDFTALYRYAKLLDNHPVRVLLPITTGFEKAARLACSLQFAVKLNIGQPSAPMLEILGRLLQDYLHRSTITQPIEFFHSMLLGLCRQEPISLWAIQEEDPALIRYLDDQGQERPPGRLAAAELGPDPAGFVERWSRERVAEGAECSECPFVATCRGYFKWPRRDYACTGVKALLHTLRKAADELRGDLAALPPRAGAPSP